MVNIMRVRTVFAYGEGGPGLMTNYFDTSSEGFTNTDAQNAVNRVRDALNTSPNLWPTFMTWTVGGEVDVLEDTTGEVFSTLPVDDATGGGTSTNTLGPLPVGLLLKMRTDVFISGRRLAGRTFFVPVQMALTATSKPTTGTRDAVVAVGTALASMGTTGVFPVIWSRPRAATAVGPGRPAGPARAARAGSSAAASVFTCPNEYVVLTSRRD